MSSRIFLVAGVLLLVCGSCEHQRGLKERYEAERDFFFADRAAGRLAEDASTRSAHNVAQAVQPLDSLVARFPGDELSDRKKYSERNAGTIKQIVWRASLRGAGLEALAGRREESLKRYVWIADRFGDDEALGPVALYVGARAEEAWGNWDTAEVLYRRIVKGVAERVWPASAIGPVVMRVPFALARLVEFSRGEAGLGAAMDSARAFYRALWEQREVNALDARVAFAETYGRERDWFRYVSELRELRQSVLGKDDERLPFVLFGMATGYAEGLSRPDSALYYCSEIVTRYPQHPVKERAELLQAYILLGKGEPRAAKRVLETLSRGASAVSATARLELGALYETEGRWDAAKAEYSSLGVYFPHSVHHYESLLRTVGHYRRSGDVLAMNRSLEESRRFLEGEVETLRGTQAALVARGYLVDIYMLAGKRDEAVRELRGISESYGDRASGVLALLKAARMLRERGEERAARELYERFREEYSGMGWVDLVTSELLK